MAKSANPVLAHSVNEFFKHALPEMEKPMNNLGDGCTVKISHPNTAEAGE
ncbi:MAG: hypothetical protein JXA44_04090 [Methanospirillaceae archaeon]|nr:hypothetical protein [Methanospirillaceae archaeon]